MRRVAPTSALRRLTAACLLVLTAFSLSGCKVTGEDIEYWKRTVKGPGKIAAVLLAPRYPQELRTQAALALVEMERRDVEGTEMLREAFARLRAADANDAQTIVQSMAPRLIEMMTTTPSGYDEEMGPPPSQLRAKDAAYSLVEHASPETRQQLTEAIVSWYSVDFANRSLAGDYSAAEIVRALGAPAAEQLVQAMNAQQPQAALVKLAELISQLGNDETKQRAAERLVEIEREMESSEFLDWLTGRIREQLAAQGREQSDDYLRAVATFNRENFINDGALPAMKHLASADVVRNRLLEIAQSRPAEGLVASLAESFQLRRQKALQALEGNVASSHLNVLLGLALDANNPVNVRDYAFDRVGDIGDQAAIPRLWPLVEFAENETLGKRLRWRAGELVLALGGSGIVGEFLGRLPSDGNVQYEPEELAGYATRMSQMTPTPTEAMSRQLRASNWYQRVIALRFFERRGTQEDVARLRRLVRDNAACVGPSWAGRELQTVGKVAENAIGVLESRLQQGSNNGGGESPSAME